MQGAKTGISYDWSLHRVTVIVEQRPQQLIDSPYQEGTASGKLSQRYDDC